MLYFNTLPKILTNDQFGNMIVLTNILARAKFAEELQNNTMLFYEYYIQDGDTPEIIASKYYDDVNRFWLVTYANQILDPVWNWPMTNVQLLDYINNKYATEAEAEDKTPYEYAISTVYKYEKIVQTTNATTDTTETNILFIDEATYNSLIESDNTYTLPSGESCTIKITKRPVYIYDYEYELNESRRNIKIINSLFANQIEYTFQELMSK